ncbi:MAG: neutral amino acid transport system ATP-binding protein [Streptosporangiaceae bacterium]|nr:neutral amino acid transport system ATP-binding protein [Streptosporangiaceae bacterium]
MTQYIIGLATTGVIFSIVTLALNVRWGWAGEFDIALFAFVAIGAYVYSVLTLGPNTFPPPSGYILGLRAPFLVGVIAAVVVAGLASAVVGAIALRKLRDDYFGITTLAFALILALVIGQYTPLFDGYEGLFGMPQPLSTVQPFGPDGGYFLGICIIALVVAFLVLQRLFNSPFGRAVRSVREDDTASLAFGRNVYLLKLKAYILGGCVAGLGGALVAAYITAFNPYGWTPQETFLIYAALFIGGQGNAIGAIIGTFFVEVGVQEVTRYVPQIGSNASSGDAIRLVLIGLLIVGILWWRPRGVLPERRNMDLLPGEARPRRPGLQWPGFRVALAAAGRPAPRSGTRPAAAAQQPPAAAPPPRDAPEAESGSAQEPAEASSRPAPTAPPAPAARPAPAAPPARLTIRDISPADPVAAPAAAALAASATLEVTHLTKAFGGVKAVDDATLSVRPGSLTGLIGPNGAGKSTMINLISGFEQPDSGRILFDGQRIEGKSSHAISRLGLMRSFQSPREWPGLTVMENMLLATPIEGRETVWRGLLTPRRLRAAESRDRVLARELLDEVGLLKLKNEPAGNLSGGQKRLLEFARLAAARPRLVLLDEPQAGVNPVLRERMAELIRSMAARGVTVLMVEHNLPFLESLCDHVIVMALGSCIATGSMSELRANASVVDAYLGQVDVADV